MHKKIDIAELDIPTNDADCWRRYPRHRWVYELSRLLDAQSVKWMPFKTDVENHVMVNIAMTCAPADVIDSGHIYTKSPQGQHCVTEVYIAKGEAKLILHLDPKTGETVPISVGDLELRISAFVTLHFIKFTGVISVETHGNIIYRIRLRSQSELAQQHNQDIVKLIKRIYRKTEHAQLSGLTDQAALELVAS